MRHGLRRHCAGICSALRCITVRCPSPTRRRSAFSKPSDKKLLAKLPKLPLGTVVDTASGKLKQIIVDQVDSMETTLAHLFPEMTANITAPVLTLVYLFVLD